MLRSLKNEGPGVSKWQRLSEGEEDSRAIQLRLRKMF